MDIDKDEITNEQIEEYKAKKCPDCDFSGTSFCSMENDDIRDCIIIDIPAVNDLQEIEG